MQSRCFPTGVVLAAMALTGLAMPGTNLKAQPPPEPASRTQGQPVASQATLPPALTLLPQQGLTLVGAGSGRLEIRDLDPVQTPRLECAVTLKNATSQPVPIDHVRGSCGCETIRLIKEGKDVAQTTLLSGEQAQVQVAIRLASGFSGEAHKFVWAYSSGSLKPLATLEIVFSLRSSVQFMPSFLNFGKIDKDTGGALPLIVRMEASLTEGGALPPLVSSNADLVVVKEGSPLPIQRDGKTWIEQKYRVQMPPHAHSGPFYGAVRFNVAVPSFLEPPSGAGTPTRSGGGASTIAMARLALLSPNLRVSFDGEVVGALAFTPKAVYLGTIPMGKGASQQVALAGISEADLQKLTVTTTSPWLSVALVSKGSANTSTASTGQILAITLNPQTPVGFLQAQVVVTIPGGERAFLPITAEISVVH